MRRMCRSSQPLTAARPSPWTAGANGLDGSLATLNPTLDPSTPLTTYSLAVVEPGGATVPTTSASGAVAVVNPLPAISAVDPAALQVGSGATLTVTGSGFAPGSTVQWQGAAVTTTFVSPTQLSAAIPAPSQDGAAQVAVVNPAPGGGASAPAVVFVSANGVSASPGSGTSTTAAGIAMATVGGAPFSPGSLTGQATGIGTLTLAQYSGSPVNAPVFGPEGGYFDIHVSPGNSFASVMVADCNLGDGHEAFWWTGSVWQLMSNQVWDAGSGCLTMTFDSSSTSPSIAQLNGTPAMVWEWSRNVGLPACIGDQFVGSHGGRLPSSVAELDNWGNSVGLRDTSTTNWSCAPTLAAPGPLPPDGSTYQRTDTGQTYTWAQGVACRPRCCRRHRSVGALRSS